MPTVVTNTSGSGGGYGNILAGDNSDFSTDLIRAALAWYASRSGTGSGDTPNFYQVPLTPEQKRAEDEKWRIYQAGGTPAMQTVGAAGKQFLSGVPSGPSNFKFMSPELQGQSFAGGVKMPTFDFSKIPTGATAPPPFVPGPGTSPLITSGGKGNLINNKMPRDGEDLYGAVARTHFDDVMRDPGTRPGMDGLARGHDDPLLQPGGGGLPSGMDFSNGSPLFQKASDWFANFQTEHANWKDLGPNIIQAGLAAAFGLPGAIAGRILARLLTRGATPAPPTPGGNTGGVLPPGGTPGNPPRP